MEILVNNILYIHILAGAVSLTTGLIAILSKKGQKWHRQSGKLYFYGMTGVFITGVIIAGFRFNRFLFLIAFLSYYSVFSGVRALKLKHLHKQQKPEWFDWFAGILNAVANVFFIGLGFYYSIENGFVSGGALLSTGFGIGGLLISYTNLKPFVFRPDKSYHWFLSHIGNMMGGYIATCTAFLSTIVTRFDFMNPYLAFAIPSILGLPLLLFWQKRIEKKFDSKS
ncbi:hypothetical protein [uncultured Aquimarina sp.]|uniref:hypothetical protein n=1 Tax=uncultured Aquimarina sp. TaxID=575652 RepID=UPI002621DC76|nr:hypothetical protein [uncultured Aquimarina sp.]